MGQALYRKYRSKSLSEVIGQDHITQTLSRAIKNGRIAHAYLFTGPKGVGKTSIARILAHEINGLDYSEYSAKAIDIIEIDAASNRKLEETKSLIEKVYVSPISAKFKVYIIDEVHMLTPESFNALLKTLEEPPEHVVFIMATTEAHKLPPTFISRTQRYTFKPIDSQKIADHLAYIAKEEKIDITPEALQIIAEHGQGSFRDSISLLDQAANYSQKVTADDVNQLLGVPPQKLVLELIQLLGSGTLKQLSSLIHQLINSGYPAAILASVIARTLREQLIEDKLILSEQTTLQLLKDLLEVSTSQNPEILLEISLLKAMPAPKAERPPQVIEELIDEQLLMPQAEDTKPLKEVKNTPKISEIKTMPAAEGKPSVEFNDEAWSEVLNLLRASYNTLYGVARMAKVDLSEPGVVKLNFAFPFHQKRVNDAKNRAIIQAAIKKVSNQELTIECIVDKGLLEKSTKDKEIDSEKLEAISSIFGGGEVL